VLTSMLATCLTASFKAGSAKAKSSSTDDLTFKTSASYSAAIASSFATISFVSSALTLSFEIVSLV